MKKYLTVTFIAFVSIFICFAPGVSLGEYYISIFDLMIGGVPGMSAVFALYLIALSSSVIISILYLVLGEEKLDKIAHFSSVLNGLIYLVCGILTFCVVPLCIGNNMYANGINIGTGSIFFGIFNIILSFGSDAITYELSKKLKLDNEEETSNDKEDEEISSNEEKEKISLLKEYKSLLDSGAITEDQYNKKRDELLK